MSCQKGMGLLQGLGKKMEQNSFNVRATIETLLTNGGAKYIVQATGAVMQHLVRQDPELLETYRTLYQQGQDSYNQSPIELEE